MGIDRGLICLIISKHSKANKIITNKTCALLFEARHSLSNLRIFLYFDFENRVLHDLVADIVPCLVLCKKQTIFSIFCLPHIERRAYPPSAALRFSAFMASCRVFSRSFLLFAWASVLLLQKFYPS